MIKRNLIGITMLFSVFFISILNVNAADYKCHACGAENNIKYYWQTYAPQGDESCNIVNGITSEEICLGNNNEGSYCYQCRTLTGVVSYSWHTTSLQDSNCTLFSSITNKNACLAKNDSGKACYACGNSINAEFKWTDISSASSTCLLQSSILTETACLSKNTKVEQCFECATNRGHSFMWTKVNPNVNTCIIRSDYTSKTACKSHNTVLSGDFGALLDEAFNIIRIVGIGLVLVLSSLDFFKGMLDGNQDTVKKASNNAFKRLIYAVIIFFLPAIVDLLISLIDGIGGTGF